MFWTSGLGKDPKRQNRWILYLDRMGSSASIIWFAKKVSRPSIKVGKTTHRYINHSFHFPGGIEFEPISVTLVDPVSPDAAANTVAILRASGYSPPENESDTTTMSKSRSIQSLGGCRLALIGADSEILEEWSCKNAWISGAKFSEMEYNEEGPLSEIELEITYDWAVLHTAEKSTTGLVLPNGLPADGNDFWGV